MLSQEAVQKILGIEEKVYVTPEMMADKMNVTFFPHSYQVSPEVEAFAEKLRAVFLELKVNIVPYDQAIEKKPLWRILRRAVRICAGNTIFLYERLLGRAIEHPYFGFSAARSFLKRVILKKGIAVIALGEQKIGNLPMEYIRSFKDNSVISILDFPKTIHEDSTFHEHFDTAMNLFAYHMTNIVIAVDRKRWMLYNFNASHPIYDLEKNFRQHVLHGLIPKIVAPISPHKFADFIMSASHFDPFDGVHKSCVDDLVNGAALFGKTNLYPAGKKIDELSFRNSFYLFIGKLHLDNRNGMSFGFLARQLPTKLSEVFTVEEAKKRFGTGAIPRDKDCFFHNDALYIVFLFRGAHLCMKVPDVFVLSQRSGSDKTRVTPEKDLVKLGLSAGKMLLETPRELLLDNNYRPSFDTKVILAHAVGNAIAASLLKYADSKNPFAVTLENNGLAISHWHGYFDPEAIPKGVHVHGVLNPHVACSSPQSAIYALDGKLRSFVRAVEGGKEYFGDIHIEPHHGSNITFRSLTELAQFMIDNPHASVLGNRYLYRYNTP